MAKPRIRAKILYVALFVAAAVISLLLVDSAAKPSTIAYSLKRRADEEHDCRLVHTASDKCSFVLQHCPDEEAGLFSYLQLYYCKLPHVQGIAFIIIALWLCLLFSTIGIAASDFFSVNLGTIAALLGLSENLAGVTFLAFGNGSPDVFSTFAAMSTHSGSLAVGELIGAAGFITAAVSGSMAIVRPFEVARGDFVRDIIFFICAATLAMVFLLDGQLLMWECVLMIVFYLLYVVVVVMWHWISGRISARKLQEATARQQYSTSPQAHDVAPDVGRTVGSRVRGSSSDINTEEQFRRLENASLDEDEAELEERSRRLALSEISQKMRVNRSHLRPRRTTRNTIRPSLVGALEFRAVLSSLERSRSQQTVPLSVRRYSDDPSLRYPPRQHFSSAQPSEDPDRNRGQSSHLSPYSAEPGAARTRNRAASANDIAALRNPKDRANLPKLKTSNALSPSMTSADEGLPKIQPGHGHPILPRPTHASPDIVIDDMQASSSAVASPSPQVGSPRETEDLRPSAAHRVSSDLLLTPHSAASSPGAPFPQYHDDPVRPDRPSRISSFKLPAPSLGIDMTAEETFTRPSKSYAWWPYRLLPPPQELFSTLFPTLYSWPERNAWERMIGIFAAPSIFLLTLTLPVVEERIIDDGSSYEAVPTRDTEEPPSPLSTPHPPLISVEGPSEAGSALSSVEPPSDGSASSATEVPALDLSPLNSPSATTPPGWNRWLICTQIIMAPLFVVLILWANMDADLSLRALALAECYAMIGALLVLAVTLYTTSSEKVPRFRPVLSFVGFVVSVAWISTIANEVVGVLKAFGVIFGISDAILGLTVFAVGNSLGDLVADITVARLGYPVMALGACIGGPMLNILLGIGIGGLYMTIREGAAHGHGESGPASYKVQVGGTLIISAVALLIILAGLLIAVPMNKWIMDRKIGLGLIALWCVSTIINVALEVSGIVSTT